MTHSRRSFLKTTAAVAAATAMRPRRAFAESGPTEPLAQFGYGDVELLEGPLRQQFDTNHAFYAALSEDSLLKPFRLRAGLPTPGEDMGGWYDWVDGVHLADGHGFCPGHNFGQMLSGLARDYAVTGNKATQAKVQRLVAGYAPAISAHFNEGNRFPAYTYDKVSIGLLDAHTFAGFAGIEIGIGHHSLLRCFSHVIHGCFVCFLALVALFCSIAEPATNLG